ncbi:MAG: HAMP domain-containing protein [Kofleriaceae bacterium]|jgi:two-component system NtrC family sensor kinase|nr:HAMP domain-containing protein [Kofleriaceae bacterium]MBP9169770.1 HAMP domain-containing protein [Kofleriaceae bacterium]MBP9862217.1 HAMP domain-containing protein [Kofleriaceae bacterium]
MTSSSRRPRTTATRIVVAFAAVLLLFGLALAVMLVSLAEIGRAEREVARLDHAKHAGHHAAAMAREQYIHQAHSLLEWNDSHVAHYQEVAAEARAATRHLRAMVTGPGPIAQADEIEVLIAESDRRFRAEVLPAIYAGARDRMRELHARTEAPVERVVAINGELNRTLERASDAAGARAEGIRARARIVVVACFALAIVLAIAVGGYLLRSISRPVAALTRGAERLGAGELEARIGLAGNDELARLSQAFDRMAADLAARQAALVEASRLASIGQVASGVAHEINNPLGVMLGYVQLLRRTDGDREELRIIEDEIRQCKAIVAGLLELARPVVVERAEVELAGLMTDAVERLADSGQSEGVAITVHGGPPVTIVGDERKLRQVVHNLLGNAVAAAREPAAAAATVEVAWLRDGADVAVTIADRGPGVPAEALPRVFEPFFTTRPRGHGLGLAIARSLARAHGGDVALRPRDGGGMVARMTVPCAAPGAS